MERRTERAYGPYRERGGWRVILAAKGARSTHRFASEDEALDFAAGFNEEGLTVKEAIERYEKHARAKGLKPRTITMMELRLRKLMEPMLDKPITRLTQPKCGELYLRLVESGAAVDTHRNSLIYARTWGRWLVAQKLWRENPWEQVEGMGKRKQGKAQLRLDEAKRWMEEAVYLAGKGEAGAVAAILTAVMGLRAGEVLGLRCRDVDDNARVLWVEGTKTDAARRVLDVPEMLCSLLGERQRRVRGDGRELLFCGAGPAYVRQWVKRICRRAKVPEVTAHGMRGLYATLAMTSGPSPEAVAATLGHTSPVVTQRHYADASAVAAASASRVQHKLLGKKVGNETGVN